jgi:hypothetical protein
MPFSREEDHRGIAIPTNGVASDGQGHPRRFPCKILIPEYLELFSSEACP